MRALRTFPGMNNFWRNFVFNGSGLVICWVLLWLAVIYAIKSEGAFGTVASRHSVELVR